MQNPTGSRSVIECLGDAINRHDLEALLERRVFLRVWVKTRRGWSYSAEAMQVLGLGD